MGILNVTPDSFSDGGRYLDVDHAIAYAHQMVEDGADIIDIGGESSRPGALPVSIDEELARVLPVIEDLANRTATYGVFAGSELPRAPEHQPRDESGGAAPSAQRQSVAPRRR